MPQYNLKRILLSIANIEPNTGFGQDAVSVGCFLFEETGTERKKILPVAKGEPFSFKMSVSFTGRSRMYD